MTKTLEDVIEHACRDMAIGFETYPLFVPTQIAHAVRDWMLEVRERDGFMSNEVDYFIERVSMKPENVNTSGGCVDAVEEGVSLYTFCGSNADLTQDGSWLLDPCGSAVFTAHDSRQWNDDMGEDEELPANENAAFLLALYTDWKRRGCPPLPPVQEET